MSALQSPSLTKTSFAWSNSPCSANVRPQIVSASVSARGHASATSASAASQPSPRRSVMMAAALANSPAFTYISEAAFQSLISSAHFAWRRVSSRRSTVLELAAKTLASSHLRRSTKSCTAMSTSPARLKALPASWYLPWYASTSARASASHLSSDSCSARRLTPCPSASASTAARRASMWSMSSRNLKSLRRRKHWRAVCMAEPCSAATPSARQSARVTPSAAMS
mmetsp:Transcript_44501/g.139586  ORF Transcript_44501/g.139586 Transcript_44501/m.139586 type:complete len:226 (-) Transcript_44501:161-838(-)